MNSQEHLYEIIEGLSANQSEFRIYLPCGAFNVKEVVDLDLKAGTITFTGSAVNSEDHFDRYYMRLEAILGAAQDFGK